MKKTIREGRKAREGEVESLGRIVTRRMRKNNKRMGGRRERERNNECRKREKQSVEEEREK